MSSNGRGRVRQYFSGPSYWVDMRTGQRIEIPKNVPYSRYIDSLGKGKHAGKWASYAREDQHGNAVLDIAHLRRVQISTRGRVNEYSEKYGSSMFVPLSAAVWHLRNIAFRKIKIQKLKFEVDMAKAAVEVFRKSFDQKKFRTWGSTAWKPLAPFTVRQRRKFGTDPSKILVDTGTLKRSIKAVPNEGKVITDPSAYTGARRHKGVCYAGIHNDPKYFGAINVSARNHVVPQRQFMGHSSYMQRYGSELIELDMFDMLFTPIV